jgi:hypothetical protein
MKNPYKIDNGKIKVDLSQNWIGFEVDEEKLEKYTFNKFIYG